MYRGLVSSPFLRREKFDVFLACLLSTFSSFPSVYTLYRHPAASSVYLRPFFHPPSLFLCPVSFLLSGRHFSPFSFLLFCSCLFFFPSWETSRFREINSRCSGTGRTTSRTSRISLARFRETPPSSLLLSPIQPSVSGVGL